MGISLDGLASGLDTTALISSVMQVEAIPQTLLKYKSQDLQSMVSALQGLNSKVAALATQATAAAKPGALDLNTATTSSDKVTATTTAAAKAGSIDFQVTKLAQTQVTVTPKVNAVVGWPYTTMTINSGAGFHDRAAHEQPGRRRKVRQCGRSRRHCQQGRRRRRRIPPAVHRHEVRRSRRLHHHDPRSHVHQRQGGAGRRNFPLARHRRSPGVKSSTNTFADLLPGVSITAKEVTAAPVTLTVARDDAGITKLASDLVAGVNGIFSYVASKTAVTSTTNTSGTSTTAGVFAGDSAVRSVNQNILSAASLPVGTPPRSPSEIGISITKTGTMEFDEKKFSAALAADPAGTAAKVQEIATRVAAAATTASDKYDGTLTKKITGQQSEVRDLADRISDWDTRLESRKATLQRTYSGLEVALSNMQAQQSWLTAQLGGLSSGSNSA